MSKSIGKHQARIGGDSSYVGSSNHSASWQPHGLEETVYSDNIHVSTNHNSRDKTIRFYLGTDVGKTRYHLTHGTIYQDGTIDIQPKPKWTHTADGSIDERAVKFILADHLNSKVKNPKTGEIITVADHHGLKSQIRESKLFEKWTQKYKKSIDCSNPKGFSQKAHCQGRKKKLNEDLRRWFKEKWTAQDGSKCGEYKGRGRVKWRPSRRVSKKSPQTWSEMSPEQKKKAVRLKQKAHREGKQFSSHRSGKTWDGKNNKYRPKKDITEDVIRTGESPQEYRGRLLRTIQSGNISSMDNHDRVHGALAYIDSIKDHYQGRDKNINLVVAGTGTDGGAKIGFVVQGIHSKGNHLLAQPAAKGAARHPRLEEIPIKNIYGLQLSTYPNMKSEHRETLRRLMDFRGLREMKEYIKQLFLERRQNKDCGCNQLDEAKKEKKPYKGFKKGKNHPEGGLSRAEARRHGIHAGIETKDEAKRKGGFNKLSKKTQSRRKSFCARMCGMKRRRTSSKTARDPKSKINAALRVWGCRCGTNESYEPNLVQTILEKRGSCWEGYKQKGMKSKNGRMVPNCVPVNESIELTEENKPTNAKLWSRAKALARSKFDVYPSAYANAWAAKWYKKHGGGWRKSKKSVKESFIQKIKGLREEVVNRDNKGSMSKKEIRSRDKEEKKGNFRGFRPIKGDTPKEMRFRIATWRQLQKCGKKGKKKSRVEKQED